MEGRDHIIEAGLLKVIQVQLGAVLDTVSTVDDEYACIKNLGRKCDQDALAIVKCVRICVAGPICRIDQGRMSLDSRGSWTG